MTTPPTPIHPAPNEEVSDLPVGTLPSSTIANIELNPELYESVGTSEASSAAASKINLQSNLSNKDKHSDSSTQNEENETDISFEDVDLAEVKQVTLPFDRGYEMLRLKFYNEDTCEKMTERQQSKLINYIDENLLKIQRKFIRNQADVIESYSVFQLVRDLLEVVDLIWCSVSRKNRLFGQSDYLIKIMGDLEDYMDHYGLFDNLVITKPPIFSNDGYAKLNELFNFFQNLDIKLSFLIDGYKVEESGVVEKLSNTQLIRLTPIASRLRILIVSRLEPLRLKLSAVTRNDKTQSQSSSMKQLQKEAKDLLNLLEIEIGRLFEGILERS